MLKRLINLLLPLVVHEVADWVKEKLNKGKTTKEAERQIIRKIQNENEENKQLTHGS